MEPLPHGLQRERHVDLAGRRGEPWVRRIVLALLALVVVGALLGAAGQQLALRAIVVFGLLLLVTRIVGRRELSTMEPFDVILLVVMGDLIQQGVTQNDSR
ncbi:MAG: hypothetical protein WKF42_05490 [Solirubrobacteraceae bacterium]